MAGQHTATKGNTEQSSSKEVNASQEKKNSNTTWASKFTSNTFNPKTKFQERLSSYRKSIENDLNPTNPFGASGQFI